MDEKDVNPDDVFPWASLFSVHKNSSSKETAANTPSHSPHHPDPSDYTDFTTGVSQPALIAAKAILWLKKSVTPEFRESLASSNEFLGSMVFIGWFAGVLALASDWPLLALVGFMLHVMALYMLFENTNSEDDWDDDDIF